MVYHNGKKGYTKLDQTAIMDRIEMPDEPYYIYDVEDGESTQGKSTAETEKIFKSEKRSPLTAAEAIALATHADVLSKHNMWTSGSHFSSADFVSLVCLYDGGAELGGEYADFSDSEGGFPSLGSRG